MFLTTAETLGGLRAREMFDMAISSNGLSNGVRKMRKRIIATEMSMRKMETDLMVYMDEEKLRQLKCEAEKRKLEAWELTEVQLEMDYRPKHVIMDPKAFVNLTECLIPQDIALSLSWGPKFTFPYVLNKLNILKFLAQLEDTVERSVPVATFDITNQEISRHLAELDDTVYDQDIQWLLFLHYRLKTFMQKNKHIVPLIADKGKVVVLMTLAEYEEKVSLHLANSQHYRKVNDDPLEDLKAREEKLLNTLRDTAATREFVGSYRSNCLQLPKFYATIKIHKNNGIRPITACAGDTVGATLSCAFNKMLTLIFPPSARHLKNAVDLKNRIDGLTLEDDDIMVSFDAISMFTSIPTTLILDIIVDNARAFLVNFAISERVIVKVANFLLNECTFFTALGGIYRQTHGLPMGGTISPICCRLVMDHIIDRSLKVIPPPLFHGVYVDDTFFVLKRPFVQQTLDGLNSVSADIRFTVEIEELNKLNFLNVTLHRREKCLITNWYKKGIASNRILNYYSSHKRSTILNTAKQYIRTVLDLSDADYFRDNGVRIDRVLIENGFPECVRIMLIHENYTLMKPFVSKQKELNTRYISFPHQTLNGPVKGIIRSYKNTDAVLTESIRNNKLNEIRSVKTRTPTELKTNTIVRGTCHCKAKIDFRLTGYNQTVGMLRKTMMGNIGDTCSGDRHVLTEFKSIGGLHTGSQTGHYMQYLQSVNHDKLIRKTYERPNRHLSKVADKFMNK